MNPLRVRWANDFVYGGVTILVGRYDGSITVNTFSIEIGNGSHTRLGKVVAEALNVPYGMVKVTAPSTDNFQNVTETGGSYTSLTAMRLAAKAAINLKNRLNQLENKTELSWLDTVRAAFHAGIPLQETVCERNSNNKDLTADFHYYAAALAVVEVDLLSGEIEIKYHHSIFDLGDPVNLALELGQIEGGFVMGLGHYKSENISQI